MCRQNRSVKSSPEEVVSLDENLLLYCKPVRLYNVLHLRSLCNPYFLPRCLSFKNRAKGEAKTLRSQFTSIVVFNYKDCNHNILKTEVVENCSCPFCFMRCGAFEGLQLHLSSTHDLFEYEFVLSEEYQTVNVSIKLDAFGIEEEVSEEDKFEPFSFCSKSRKHRKRGGRNNARRLNVRFLPLESPNLANEIQNGISMLNDGNCGIPITTSPAIGSQDSDARTRPPSEAAVSPPAKVRKLSAERSGARSHLLLKKRQFYHSHRVQPMSLEQVMSDRDSEDELDDDVATVEDRHMLEDFVDVSSDEKHFMHLWNSFVRKQRILADGHVPWACEAFSKFHKKELLDCPPLAWCWRIFMIKLWNHGLVDPSTINNCNLILENNDNNSDNNNNTNGVVNREETNNNIGGVDAGEDDSNNKDK